MTLELFVSILGLGIDAALKIAKGLQSPEPLNAMIALRGTMPTEHQMMLEDFAVIEEERRRHK